MKYQNERERLALKLAQFSVAESTTDDIFNLVFNDIVPKVEANTLKEVERTTGGQKIAKKARRLYTRDMRREARKVGHKMGEVINRQMKPKPKYMPWPVWMFIVKLVLRVK